MSCDRVTHNTSCTYSIRMQAAAVSHQGAAITASTTATSDWAAHQPSFPGSLSRLISHAPGRKGENATMSLVSCFYLYLTHARARLLRCVDDRLTFRVTTNSKASVAPVPW